MLVAGAGAQHQSCLDHLSGGKPLVDQPLVSLLVVELGNAADGEVTALAEGQREGQAKSAGGCQVRVLEASSRVPPAPPLPPPVSICSSWLISSPAVCPAASC